MIILYIYIMATLEVLENIYKNNINIKDIINEKADVPLQCPASMSGGGIVQFFKEF